MDFNKLRLLAGINIQVPTTLSATDSNEIRKLAGLPILPESKKHKEEKPSEDEVVVGGEGSEASVEDTPTEADAPIEGEGSEEEESKEALITKIATHLEGKSVDEISAMLHQIYDAGYADAKKHTEDAINGTKEEEEEGEESSDEDDEIASEDKEDKEDKEVKESLNLIKDAQFRQTK